MPEIVLHTVYVPAPQPTATPELPVKVIVIPRQSQGGDDEGREGESD